METDKGIKDKVVCITGASSGIGQALAEGYALNGAHLVLIARRADRLEELRQQCERHTNKVHTYAFDLTQIEEIPQLVSDILSKSKTIDLLINNAGISQRSLAEETPLENDRKIMEINFFAAVALTKAVLPTMIKQKKGHIAVISSVVGKFGFPMRTTYSASKHAVQGFFESLRAELKPHHVHVTVISPGRIRTEVSQNALAKDGHPHGQMDPGQNKGMPPEICAQRIIKGIQRGKKDLLVGRKELLMVFIRKYFPGLYHKMVSKVSAT